MEGFWITLGWGLASLLAVSVLVALHESLREGREPGVPLESPMPRALRIDVDLDAMAESDATAAPAAAGPALPHDADARRAALSGVLHRLQQNPPDAPWIETTPMVLARQANAETR